MQALEHVRALWWASRRGLAEARVGTTTSRNGAAARRGDAAWTGNPPLPGGSGRHGAVSVVGPSRRRYRDAFDEPPQIRPRGVPGEVRHNARNCYQAWIFWSSSAADLRRTDADVVRRVDELLDHHAEHEIATLLNAEALRTGPGLSFNLARGARFRPAYGLKSRYDRLRERGLLTVQEMVAALDVEPYTVKIWRAAGLLAAYPYNAKNQCLYEPPRADRPRKHTWKGLTAARRAKSTTRSTP